MNFYDVVVGLICLLVIIGSAVKIRVMVKSDSEGEDEYVQEVNEDLKRLK